VPQARPQGSRKNQQELQGPVLLERERQQELQRRQPEQGLEQQPV
jgi:hypothetical protein